VMINQHAYLPMLEMIVSDLQLWLSFTLLNNKTAKNIENDSSPNIFNINSLKLDQILHRM
jgi:hypothetical protein